MNRRNVLIGLGTAAVGTGAAFGSGAFTQVETERAVSVDVVGDGSAHVALVDNGDVEAATNTTASSGDLEIKLDSGLYGSGDGVNRNATIRVSNESSPNINGSISGKLENAFKIVNNSNKSIDIKLEVNSGSTNELSAFYYDSSGTSGSVTDSTSTFSGESIDTLAEGGAVAVAITVKTGGDTNIADNPQIRVTATDAS